MPVAHVCNFIWHIACKLLDVFVIFEHFIPSSPDPTILQFQSTYCNTIVQHCATLHRTVHVVNLDPAAEHFSYPVLAGASYTTLSQIN